MSVMQDADNMNSDNGIVSLADVKKTSRTIPKKMLTRKEAAEYLGVSVTTLDSARNAGKISYVQYVENGSVFFTETALQEYIARCTHRAVPQKENMMTYRKRRA